MLTYKVVGKQIINSKKSGKTYINLHCTTDFHNSGHCEGIAVDNLFFEYSKDIPIGSMVRPIYEKSFKGNAILVDVQIIEEG